MPLTSRQKAMMQLDRAKINLTNAEDNLREAYRKLESSQAAAWGPVKIYSRKVRGALRDVEVVIQEIDRALFKAPKGRYPGPAKQGGRK